MASKLRFRIILPLVQLLIALGLVWMSGDEHPAQRGLEYWVPPAWLLCRALNAPALVFDSLASALVQEHGPSWLPETLQSRNWGEIPFLIGVIVVWYFVGRAWDTRGLTQRRGWWASSMVVIRNLVVLSLGGLLLALAWHDFGNAWTPFAAVCAVVIFLWSVALTSFSTRGLVRLLRLRPA